MSRVQAAAVTNTKPVSTTSIDPNSAADFYGLFTDTGKPSSSEEQKIKTLRHKILTTKDVPLKDSNALWILRSNSSNGDVESAFDLLLALSNASECIVVPYDSRVRLRGAVNRKGVTCFLDATLFAMFSRLDSFEAMLYNTFEDVPRSKLSFLLRIWVNLLRMGKLIPTDITVHIQESLAECGWKDAGELHQQDASEAFTFITETLRLPLLTLKMDMYHSGKQDADDHRFINERLLEVAIPSNANGERKDIRLEDCLEDYFNNRIEVRRFLERRSTLTSMRSFDSSSKGGAVHVEAVELDGDMSPLTPITPLPSYTSAAPPFNRNRAPSIIQERWIPEKEESTAPVSPNPLTHVKSPVGRLRNGSVRKEVIMPAWQFFSLIPWYTDNTPSSDAQVAAHFSSKRPILGLCLKRYSILPNGKAIRLNTHVDIPVEIALPHFIQDDQMNEDGPVFGNFKLSLQSVVCHRGQSVDSGHYISLVRGTTRSSHGEESVAWMRFDDLASERITMVEIHKALDEETPYLLFYQIMPIEGDPGNLTAGEVPPTYESSLQDPGIGNVPQSGEAQFSAIESPTPSSRPSLDLPSPDEIRGRAFAADRRPSAISFTEKLPAPRGRTTDDTGTNSRHSTSLSRTYNRNTNRSMNALTKTLSNLSAGKSKEPQVVLPPADNEVVVEVRETLTSNSSRQQPAADFLKVDDHQSKSHKREKSKNRLGRSGKLRKDDPDRECVVM